jgi:predicted oxidoreductase
VSDVIVIGGGIAGICAALELLDASRRVLLLERDTEDNFGGLAKESFGGIFLVGTPEQRRAGIRGHARTGAGRLARLRRTGPE